MKKWEKGKIGELMTLAKKAPVQWVIATASKNYPDATADEIYNEVSTSNDPYTTAVMKFGLTPIYDHSITKERTKCLCVMPVPWRSGPWFFCNYTKQSDVVLLYRWFWKVNH